MTVETLDLRVGKGFELMKPSSVQVPMIPHLLELSLLHGSLVAQTVKNLPAMLETWVRSLGRKIPWKKEWQPTPVFLPGEFHGQRSLVGYSLKVTKSQNNRVTNNFTFTSVIIYMENRYWVASLCYSLGEELNKDSNKIHKVPPNLELRLCSSHSSNQVEIFPVTLILGPYSLPQSYNVKVCITARW